jgi:hypothetical protein
MVRHVTQERIPGSARRNQEECSWVTQSTLSRKATGKTAYWESHRIPTDERGRGWRDPCGMGKAKLPEVQSADCQDGAHGKASETRANLCRSSPSRLLQPPQSGRWLVKPRKPMSEPPPPR